jgi:hypothetical protein
MENQDINRLYKFSDAILITKAKSKIAFIRRDAAEFMCYGITSVMIDELEASVEAFLDITTDIEMLGDQIEITKSKNAKAGELRAAIRNVMGRVQLKFGINSGQYKSFGTGTLSKQTRGNLMVTGKLVVRRGTRYLPELAANGLTVEMLDVITVLYNEFIELIIDQDSIIADRDQMQEARVEAGNALYSALVSYTATGFVIWETASAARYNDYVIYQDSSVGKQNKAAV